MTKEELHKKVLKKKPKLLVNLEQYSELLDIFTEIFNENNNIYIQQKYLETRHLIKQRKKW